MSDKSMIIKFDVPMYAVVPEDNHLYKAMCRVDNENLKMMLVNSVVSNPGANKLVSKALDKACMRRDENNKLRLFDDAIRIYINEGNI